MVDVWLNEVWAQDKAKLHEPIASLDEKWKLLPAFIKTRGYCLSCLSGLSYLSYLSCLYGHHLVGHLLCHRHFLMLPSPQAS
jgi:hypothetical protein